MLVLTNQQQKIAIYFEGWIFVSLRWVMMILSRKNHEFITKLIPWSPFVLLLETTFKNYGWNLYLISFKILLFLIVHRFLTSRASSLGSDLRSCRVLHLEGPLRGPPLWSSGEDSTLPLQGAQVQSLVGELRSHIPKLNILHTVWHDQNKN